MSFKLTYKELNDRNFMGAMEELSAIPLAVKPSYNISKILRLLKNQMKEGQDTYMAILKKHVELDEKGNIIPQMLPEKKNEKGEVTQTAQPLPGTYAVKEGQNDAFKKEVEDFLSIDFEIPCNKIQLMDLQDTKIKPAILHDLEPVLVDIASV